VDTEFIASPPQGVLLSNGTISFFFIRLWSLDFEIAKTSKDGR
jgi:hypothetical protein